MLDVAGRPRSTSLVGGARHDSGLPAEPSPFRRGTMACTGIEFCKLAIVETKARAIALVDELEKRLADVDPDVPITINLNGCPNACARTQVADIGLKGRSSPTPTASRSRASRCTWAAASGWTPASAASCAGTRSPATSWATTSSAWCGSFDEQREPTASGSPQWVARADESRPERECSADR